MSVVEKPRRRAIRIFDRPLPPPFRSIKHREPEQKCMRIRLGLPPTPAEFTEELINKMREDYIRATKIIEEIIEDKET